MPEENGNGKNGNRVGLLERVKAGVKEDVQSLKTDMPAKAKEQIDGLKDPTKTQVFTSIFRHKHDDTPRNRALGVLSNVFLHLHPAKINRDAVRYSYTWGMGGITFYLFIVLTFTGVLLMFYYHPSKVQAFRDVLYLEHDVPFGKLLRNMHRWAAHLMVIAVWLHMFRVFLTGSYKKPREFNWNIGVLLVGFHAAAFVHGLPATRRSTRILGSHGGNKHGSRNAAAGTRRPLRQSVPHDALQRHSLRTIGWFDRGRECVASLLHLALYWHSDRGFGSDDRAFLAGKKRRRHLRPGASDADRRGGQASPQLLGENGET